VNAGIAGPPGLALSVEEARAAARDRFRDRLQAGEPVGGCACHDETATRVVGAERGGPAETVAGVRFRDSGRTYYFRTGLADLVVGDWVVTETGRGQEAGRVVIAPHQVAVNALQGDLTPILRRMTAADIERMDGLRGQTAQAVRTCAAIARGRRLPIKVIAVDFSFDGAAATVNYSVHDRERSPDGNAMREFAREAAAALGCRVDARQVGPRDEARLLGGLGRCGRTLCCSSWLPVFPEISMNMAKTQDLPLNPSKVSGVCGRLLCCLSYENEQYKQMKALMPRLGQSVQTPTGPGVVVAMQLLKELVTVRLEGGANDITLPVAEIGPGPKPSVPVDAAPTAPLRETPAARLVAPTPMPSGVEAVAETLPHALAPTPGTADAAAGTVPSAGSDPASAVAAEAAKKVGRRRRRRGGSGQGGRHPGQS
jgi:cell fate regulator YaaT (PSP1 superfamily)